MKNKNKVMRNILIGMIGAAICMLASWFTGAYGKGNVTNGYIQSNWPKMSYWRFEVGLVLSSVGLACMFVGLRDLSKAIKMIKRRHYSSDRFMGLLFEAGFAATVMSYLCICSAYTMIAIVYKLLFNTSLMGADIISVSEGMFFYVAIPLVALLAISVIGVSVPFMYFVLTGGMRINKLCFIFNPLIIFGGGELLRLTKVYYLVDFSAAALSFGYLLLMAAGMSYVAKIPEKRRIEKH